MDSLIAAAGRALVAGDVLGALKHVALREDPPALALRGIAMAQLGEYPRARELLRRAVRNLLDNALDFSPDGGVVRLECESASRTIALRVTDRGPGIPEYADEKVFEKFYSLARPGTQKRSTGLGLAFVKEIAELHQGRVSLVNDPAGGAVATLSLPRAEAPS